MSEERDKIIAGMKGRGREILRITKHYDRAPYALLTTKDGKHYVAFAWHEYGLEIDVPLLDLGTMLCDLASHDGNVRSLLAQVVHRAIEDDMARRKSSVAVDADDGRKT